MATPAQIAANQRNAVASTGPRTPAGKSRSSTNALTLGLFTLRNVIQPGEEEEYTSLTTELWRELSPEGPVEQALAVEIMRAIWRLQRCSNLEARLGDPQFDDETWPTEDPMAHPATLATQSAIDRARLQNHRILNRSMAELRRIQTERQFRHEVLPKDFNTDGLGLASYTELIGPMATEARWKRLTQQINGLESFESVINARLAPTPLSQANPDPAKRTQFAAETPAPTPRNAACPCGSGQKYKRCCGHNADPVLYNRPQPAC